MVGEDFGVCCFTSSANLISLFPFLSFAQYSAYLYISFFTSKSLW